MEKTVLEAQVDSMERANILIKFPLVYLFGPIDSCPDGHGDWRSEVKKSLHGVATMFDPMAAFSSSPAGQEIVPINEMVVDSAEILLGVWYPSSVGTSREVERALIRGKMVVVVHPPVSGCVSPYYLDRRVTFSRDVDSACGHVRMVLNGLRSDV